MSESPPVISVVVPTHNRSGSLRRTLDALSRQTHPMDLVEVLVVADGCTDDTAAMLASYRAPYDLRVLEMPGSGPAAARNAGAAAARAELLLFLDDDVEPTPALVGAHLRAHRDRPGHVVLGPYRPALTGPLDLFRIALRDWWEDQFSRVRHPAHRFTYRDLLSGNLSLPARLFAQSGGFDPAFRRAGGEDWELGIRLLKAGAQFAAAPDALARHHDASDLDRSLRRARDEGRADVLIGRRHPELRRVLPLAQLEITRSRAKHALCAAAFRWPRGSEAAAGLLRRLLDVLEALSLRRQWRRLFGALRQYWYWRGVADELGGQGALSQFLQSGTTPMVRDEIALDLRAGLAAAEERLDRLRPSAATIRLGRHPVGGIPAEPGAERLRGAHLRPYLVKRLAAPLMAALALERALGEATPDHLQAVGSPAEGPRDDHGD